MPTTTGAALWSLIDRWKIKDEDALRLIDQGPSPSGKRPRFALTTEQTERLAHLKRIDFVATDIHGDAGDWIRRPNKDGLFGGKPPLKLMLEGRQGLDAVSRHLDLSALGGSLKRSGKKAR